MRNFIILTALSAVTVFAGEELLVVHRAQMGADMGKVVLSGEQLLFVDDTAPERSFSIARPDVQSLYLTNGRLSLQLQTGSIQLTDPASASVVTSWSGLPLNTADRVMRPGPGVVEFNIRHDDDSGRLLVGDRGLTFEALSNATKSRGWSYAEVKEFKRDGDRQLKIRTYGGEEFKFRLIDREMSDEIYNMVADRIVSARRP
jgi:hypothetical protein